MKEISLWSALLLLLGCTAFAEVHPPADKEKNSVSHIQNLYDPYTVAKEYVTEFYPLFLSYEQTRFATPNRLAGPDRISPLYHIVVAINVDTLYASSFGSVKDEPLIVTIPTTSVSYSILTLDAYGNIFETGIQAGTPGTYALTGPGWTGVLPLGIKPYPVPVNFFVLIFRADKFSSAGVDQTVEADQFRRSLRAQTLTDYLANPDGGATVILPESEFSLPIKTIADRLITNKPVTFLKQLQQAVASSNTPTLTARQAKLSQVFDQMFRHDPNNSQLIAGAQAAHHAIVNGYKNKQGPTHWINFEDIGAWGEDSLARSQISEYIQYANGRKTALYYHAFRDANNLELNGSHSNIYKLTFPAGQLPPASRFWSVTAYTPNAVELVPNLASKYVVASYTPPEPNVDGSVTLFMSHLPPVGIPQANWLPVPDGPFNVMLRIYGSEGTALAGTYMPPAIELASH